MAAGDGTAWITEAARPLLAAPGTDGSSFSNASSHRSLCAALRAHRLHAEGCDGGGLGPLNGDAGTRRRRVHRRRRQRVPADAGPHPVRRLGCRHDGTSTKTMCESARLRADLPASALSAGDLHLEASPAQDIVASAHTTQTYSVANYNPCGPGSVNLAGTSPTSNSGGSCHVGGPGEGSLILFGIGITGVSTHAATIASQAVAPMPFTCGAAFTCSLPRHHECLEHPLNAGARWKIRESPPTMLARPASGLLRYRPRLAIARSRDDLSSRGGLSCLGPRHSCRGGTKKEALGPE